MNKTVICPGSFDPVTLGHLDVITRASKLFDRVIVGVLVNSSKKPIFSIDERIELLKEVTEHLNNVEIVGFNGLLAQYCEEHGVDAIVKGLRAVTDFEYEFQMAHKKKKLNQNIERLRRIQCISARAWFVKLPQWAVTSVILFLRVSMTELWKD